MEEPLINAIQKYFKLKTAYEKQFVDLKKKNTQKRRTE